MRDDSPGKLTDPPAMIGMPAMLNKLADGRLDEAGMETVLAALWAAGEADPPPSWVVNRAVRIGRQSVEQTPTYPKLWRRVVATLVCDSRLQLRAAGVRGIGGEPTRVLYAADDVLVDLEVTEGQAPGGLRLLGQVTATPSDLLQAWIAAEGPLDRVEVTVDELGQFSLDGVVPGTYRLEVGLPAELIVIDDLPIDPVVNRWGVRLSKEAIFPAALGPPHADGEALRRAAQSSKRSRSVEIDRRPAPRAFFHTSL